MKEFKDLGIQPTRKGLTGTKINIDEILNNRIEVHDFRIEPSKYAKNEGDKCLYLQFKFGDKMHVVFISAIGLMDVLQRIPETDRPFLTTIRKENRQYIFT